MILRSFLACALVFTQGPLLFGADYIKEHVYDDSVHQDESLVNVRLINNRWPDCTTLETAIQSIFRIEGVTEKSDHQKALALWKWYRILVSSLGGGYAYEEGSGKPRIVRDPHKIFTVYGHHQCDGLSWAMVPLWRAAGYIAHDCPSWGHTTAALRYKDDDGEYRFHNFDPQARFYYWDDTRKIVGTRTMPVASHSVVYRHITTPINLHSLRTSLRIGEVIERRWDNTNHIVPSGKDKVAAIEKNKWKYYTYEPGKTKGIFSAVGEEVQTLEIDATPERFAKQLYDGSVNTACSGGKLHPKKASEKAVFIYRLAPPYVVADAKVEATLFKSADQDICELSFSHDGKTWKPLAKMEKKGEQKVELDVGFEAYMQKKPNAYTWYDMFVKAELKTDGAPTGVGMKSMKLTAIRMLNKRTLPNLRPGENVLKVVADKLDPKQALEVEIKYTVKGKAFTEKRSIGTFPHYFKIEVKDAVPYIPKSKKMYDEYFNVGDLKMVSYKMRLVPAAKAGEASPSLAENDVVAKFKASSPHPADLNRKKNMKNVSTHIRQVNGFFPQSVERKEDEKKMNELINGKWKWRNIEALGNYPAAVDALLKKLPSANGDITLFIVKALAQIGDKKAIGPLLAKWERVPRGGPGTRYIPDALAALGATEAVPALIAPLSRVRFDYRFHIAHALGILGGEEAKKTLKDLAENDPLRAIREYAGECLAKLEAGK